VALRLFFKNILDWLSRRSDKVFDDKAVLLMSTSPGRKGGMTNRKLLEHRLPFMGANIASTFSLPSFNHNMKGGKISGELLQELENAINKLTQDLHINTS
jgi:NAD(P)H-dependent FMN reductase